MLCNNCHSSNAAGAKFCAVCGAALQDDYQQEYQNDGDSMYGYDDGFSVNRAEQHEERHDYEYYHDDNGYGGNFNNGYDGGYNNGYDGGYNNGYNGGYNNNGYGANNGYGGYNNSGYGANNGYGVNSGYNYSNFGGYNPQTPLRPSRPSGGAIAIYMISGVFALLGMLMTVLPNFDSLKLLGKYSSYYSSVSSSDRYENVFSLVKKFFEGKSLDKSDAEITAVIILMMFVTPMIFQLLWAILSFCRNRGAGAIGMVGSIIYLSVSSFWVLFLRNELPVGKYYITGSTTKTYSGSVKLLGVNISDAVTVVPYLMVALGVAGIVFSAIQIAKRDRVR